MPAHERTPLLAPAEPRGACSRRSRFSPLYRVYFMTFIVGIALSFAQTAVVESLFTMACDEYYKLHEWDGAGDRCRVRDVMMPTYSRLFRMRSNLDRCTLVNLVASAWFISRFGVKPATLQQMLWAALRTLTEVFAQAAGGQTGINIIMATPFFGLFSSTEGFLLCANVFVVVLAAGEARTASFGVVAGVAYFGLWVGVKAGGASERAWGHLAPVHGAFCLLVLSIAFIVFFLPNEGEDTDEGIKGNSALAPLGVFLSRRRGETRRRDWSLLFLGLGAFLFALAMQPFEMAFELFRPRDTSDLLESLLSLDWPIRAVFLTLCFPALIAAGRRWVAPAPNRVPPMVSELPGPWPRTSSQSPDRSATTPTHARRPTFTLPSPPIPNIPRRRSSTSSRRDSISTPAASYITRALPPIPSSALGPARPRPPVPESPFDERGCRCGWGDSSPDAPPPYESVPPFESAAPKNGDGNGVWNGAVSTPSPAPGPSPAPVPAPAPAPAPAPGPPAYSVGFDLLFLRCAMLLNAVLMLLEAAGPPQWLCEAAAILPIAGTGPAIKGVAVELVPRTQIVAALAGIALLGKLGEVSLDPVFELLYRAGIRGLSDTVVYGVLTLLALAMVMLVRLPRRAGAVEV